MEENKELMIESTEVMQEEITDFPQQTTFNEDDMSIIVEDGEEDED